MRPGEAPQAGIWDLVVIGGGTAGIIAARERDPRLAPIGRCRDHSQGDLHPARGRRSRSRRRRDIRQARCHHPDDPALRRGPRHHRSPHGRFHPVVPERSERIVGGVIVGPRAGESLAEVVLAIRHRMRAGDIGAAMHAYPTYGDGVWKAAIAEGRARLQQPITRRGIALIARARRLLRR